MTKHTKIKIASIRSCWLNLSGELLKPILTVMAMIKSLIDHLVNVHPVKHGLILSHLCSLNCSFKVHRRITKPDKSQLVLVHCDSFFSSLRPSLLLLPNCNMRTEKNRWSGWGHVLLVASDPISNNGSSISPIEKASGHPNTTRRCDKSIEKEKWF